MKLTNISGIVAAVLVLLLAVPRPGAAASCRHDERRRHCRPRRRRRARQARAAGARSHRGRLRGVRGRCGPEDRLVHAGPAGSGRRWHDGGCRPRAGGGRPATPASGVDTGPAVTAIVFDGLELEKRKRAVQAAQAYLGDKEEMPNYVGIFGIDLSLTPLVPFTRNGVVAAPGAEPDGHGQHVRLSTRRRCSSSAQGGSAAATSAANAANRATAGAAAGMPARSGPRPGDAMLAQMESQHRVRASRSWSATSPATSPPTALFAIISTLRRLPGARA